MSLSWPNLFPNIAVAGLFADHCWLQGRQAAVAHSIRPEALNDSMALLLQLEILLDERKKYLRKGTRLALTVSDSLAAFTMLPWQEALQRPAELASYAHIFFERQGLKLDSSWVLHTEFNRYGANGIAYALRHDWLQKLEEIVFSRNLRLISVLPVSAAAFCQQPKHKKSGNSLLLLSEQQSMTALRFNVQGLQSHDVEPVIGSEQSSGKRLLRRLASTQPPGLVQGCLWSPLPVEQRGSNDFIAESLHGIQLHSFPHGVWS